MCGSLSLHIIPTAVCPGWFLAREAEVKRSNPMSHWSEPVSFLRWPGYSWDAWAECVVIACLWPSEDRSGLSSEWNDGFGCSCNDGLVHLKRETSLLFSKNRIAKSSLQLWVSRKLGKIIQFKCLRVIWICPDKQMIFTKCFSCFCSGTSRPLEDFRLSKFTWRCYKNNGFLLTSEISTRSRCGLQSIQKCPAQRSHQTDVSRWVPAPQMLYIYVF